MVIDTVVRQLARALPDAGEQDHHGFSSFRVGGRIFASLHSRDRLRVMLDEHGSRDLARIVPRILLGQAARVC